jgi:hypothetical protein
VKGDAEDPRIAALRAWQAKQEGEISDSGGWSRWHINKHENRFREASSEQDAAKEAWEAIGTALHGGLPIPEWTYGYLRSVADCMWNLRRGHRPSAGRGRIASAIAAAVLEPSQELKRMELHEAEAAVRHAEAALAMARQKRIASELPRRENNVKHARNQRDRCRREAKPRRVGRGANPFAMDERLHGIRIAQDVWEAAGQRWAKNKDEISRVARPTKRMFEKAAEKHATYCDECRVSGKTYDWKRVQQLWLLHEDAVTPRYLRGASKHAR